jgi:hypothetical protein
MSPRMRIGVHRAAFLSFCLAPTLLLAAWIAYAAPSRGAAADTSLWEEELSWILGLDVQVERVEQPELGRTVLYGVEISDPEWGGIGRIRALELARTEQGVVIVASQPEMRADRLLEFGRLVHDRFLRTRRAGDLPVHFLAGELTLTVESDDPLAPPRGETLTDVDLWISSSEEGPQLSAEFHLAAAPAAQPVQCRVVRKHRSGEAPTTWWSLDTQADRDSPAAAMPCWLLSQLLPSLAALGDDSRFAGHCHAELAGAGWDGKVVGRFDNVDLLRLVRRRGPRVLSGRADLELIAEMRASRVVSAKGSLDSHGGTIRSEFVDAAIEQFPLQLSPTAQRAAGEDWRYRRLAVEFDMTGEGIRLTGWCDSKGDTLLLDDNGPLVVRKHDPYSPLNDLARTPLVNLVRLLVRPSSSQVPAGREAETLMAVLPIPPSPPVAGEPPRATLRPN